MFSSKRLAILMKMIFLIFLFKTMFFWWEYISNFRRNWKLIFRQPFDQHFTHTKCLAAFKFWEFALFENLRYLNFENLRSFAFKSICHSNGRKNDCFDTFVFPCADERWVVWSLYVFNIVFNHLNLRSNLGGHYQRGSGRVQNKYLCVPNS